MYKEVEKQWSNKYKDNSFYNYKVGQIKWGYILNALDQFRVKSILEFGCGLSTLLFENYGCKVTSFETNDAYRKDVNEMTNTDIQLWDGKNANIDSLFDMAFIDGALPRKRQIQLASKCTDLIIVDDFNKGEISDFVRIDDQNRLIGVFVRRINHGS